MEEIHLSDDEWALFKYIPNKIRLKSYVSRMKTCETMDEVENCVLLPMLLHEPNITTYKSEKKDFYSRLKPFIQHLRGSGSTALYERICELNRMLNRENKNKLSFNGLLQQIEVAMPKPGEGARCIVELIITPSDDKGRMMAIAATLAGVEYRQVTNKHFDGETGVNISAKFSVIRGNAHQLFVWLGCLREYWNDEDFSIRYKSDRIDRDGLSLTQAQLFAENNV